VQVDLDARQLDKVFRADLAIRGDIRAVLSGGWPICRATSSQG